MCAANESYFDEVKNWQHVNLSRVQPELSCLLVYFYGTSLLHFPLLMLPLGGGSVHLVLESVPQMATLAREEARRGRRDK